MNPEADNNEPRRHDGANANDKRPKYSLLLLIISILLSSGTYLIVTLFISSHPGYDYDQAVSALSRTDFGIKSLDDLELKIGDLKSIRNSNSELVSILKELKTASAENQTQEIQKIITRVVSIEQKLSKIENDYSVISSALINDPLRAMSIPLLRKDVDIVAEQTKELAIHVRAENERMIAILQWLGTFIIGLLTAAAALFVIQRR